MTNLSKEYWNSRYQNEDAPWDIGTSSPALIDYFIKNDVSKNASILFPGAGYCHDHAHLYQLGYHNTTTCDWSRRALEDAKKRYPDIPNERFIEADFFEHSGTYDYVVEQTFLSALRPDQRTDYIRKIHELLNKQGRLIGLVFANEFKNPGPPFGGNKEIYLDLFKPLFKINKLSVTANSILPRLGNEFFMDLSKM